MIISTRRRNDAWMAACIFLSITTITRGFLPSYRNQHSALILGSTTGTNTGTLQEKTVKELWQILEDANQVEPGLKSQLRRKQDIIDYIEQQQQKQQQKQSNVDHHDDDSLTNMQLEITEEMEDRKKMVESSLQILDDIEGEPDNDDNDDDIVMEVEPEEGTVQPARILLPDIEPEIADLIPTFLADKLVQKGIHSLLPIQQKSFERIYSGKDAVLQAPTGSGKTFAYVFPLASRKPRGRRTKVAAPRILVLVPARELARQVGNEFSKYSQKSSNCATVYGGVPLERHASLLKKNKPQVVVSTPGRLRELAREGHLDYSQISTVVLDEAETLLDKADSPDVRSILKDLEEAIGQAPERHDNPEYQLLLVSATVNQNVVEFARELELPSKALIRVEGRDSKVLVGSSSSQSTNDSEIDKDAIDAQAVEHWHISCKTSVRPKVSLDLISILAPRLTIIFVATKAEAEGVASFLSTKLGGNVRVLHGDMVQSARSRSIALVREVAQKGIDSQVLVATDVASRGIDLPVDLLIQFGVPRIAGKENTFSTELYTHRTGRTGRFNTGGSVEAGNAIMLYDPAAGEGKLIPLLAAEVHQELGIGMQPKQLPSAAEVVAAGYQRAKESISLGNGTRVENDLVSYFRQVIETEKGVDTSDPEQILEYLSRAMALLSNLDPAMSPFHPHASLLSGSDTDRTLRLYCKSGESLTPPEVIKICKEWGSGKLGRVAICQDGSAVFDLPQRRAIKLLESSKDAAGEMHLELPVTLPDLSS